MHKFLFTIFVVTFITFTCNSTSRAISIEFVQDSQQVPFGNTANVAVMISGLGDNVAPSLGVFDITIEFDPSILIFKSAAYGDPDPALGDQLDLFGAGFPLAITSPGIGSVELFELSFNTIDDLNNNQAPSFILATLTFDTIGVGTSPLNISNYVLSDASGGNLSANIGTGQIDVIPEPGTLLLFVCGLPVLHYLKRKMKRSE